MHTTAIVKASTLSPHFPDRYSHTFQGVPLLEFIIRRIQQVRSIDSIVLTTSSSLEDDVIVTTAFGLGIEVYRDDFDDSLGRLYGAANLTKPDTVVKVFGHYPLIDPAEIDRLVGSFHEDGFSYGYSEHPDGLILGMGAEVFTYKLLKKVHKKIHSPVDRCFGSQIFRDFLDTHEILKLPFAHCRPSYRVTLAVPDDVLIINKIIEECSSLGCQEVVEYLDNNPILVKFARNNISGAREVGLEKILLFPEKVSQLLIKQDHPVDLSYPVSVELSLTNRCNLSCRWCSDQTLRERSMVDIEFDVIKRLLKDLAGGGTKGVVIEGGGEPSLYSRFTDVISVAKELGLNLGLITNGMHFGYRDYIGAFDWIRISLDAADKDQFYQGKGVDAFDRVMSNIQEMCSRRRNNVVVGVGYVLTNKNVEGLEDIVLKLRKIGVDYFQLRPVIDHNDMRLKRKDFDFLTKHSTMSFSVNIQNMEENLITGNDDLPCRAHSLSSVICADGNVYLCGRLNKYDWFESIGNIKEQRFFDIWNGPKREDQAKRVMDREYCSRWCPECRMTKYNKLFARVGNIKTINFI